MGELLTFDGNAALDLLNTKLPSHSTRTKGWSHNELQESAFGSLDETVHKTIARGSIRTKQRNQRPRSRQDQSQDCHEPLQDFATQLGNAAEHLRGRSKKERDMSFRARENLQNSKHPALSPKKSHRNRRGRSSSPSPSDSMQSSKVEMPSPYRCMGDFCDFTIEDPDGLADTNVRSGSINVVLDPAQRGGAVYPNPPTANNPHGSMGLVTRILSSYETEALKSSPDFFNDLSTMMGSADEDQKMYNVTRKSVILARQERRKGARPVNSSASISCKSLYACYTCTIAL